jgi:taurine dioxygenase
MTVLDTQLRVEPSGRGIGADIVGLDLREPIYDETLVQFKQAWYDHLVLRVRGQVLTDAELLTFTRRIGTVDVAPQRSFTATFDTPESAHVLTISNVVENGKPIGELGDAEAFWHQDMTYHVKPPVGAALYALELPPRGGNTEFCNLYRAYETLPPAVQDRIQALSCVHDISMDSAGRQRKGHELTTDPRKAQGPTHPLVCTHPRTDRKYLFLGRRPFAYIPTLELEDSEELLNLLWAHCAAPELRWTQEWQIGDLILWDNRCTMHRRDSFDPRTRRVLHRTQLADD